MKIGIMSDTHLDKHPEKIVEYIDKYFNDVDLIIHAGDYTNCKVIELIKSRKKFIGVWGNVDKRPVRSVLNEKEIINVEGKKIGIFHGHGDKKTTPERAIEIFKDDNADIIIFGHSHQPSIFTKNKTLLLNPGSLSRKRKEPWFSYIILTIDKNSISAEMKFFTKI
ncbi:phosphoesterase [Clostridium omnivorum]|uniref:Phosphoesterase n=1 Tax=Clostridium omnivorum TaxID=1604902 RepID=A0ABQ5N9U6_9CLOT|nr:phosphoesterase [Clostridium sp. E14]